MVEVTIVELYTSYVPLALFTIVLPVKLPVLYILFCESIVIPRPLSVLIPPAVVTHCTLPDELYFTINVSDPAPVNNLQYSDVLTYVEDIASKLFTIVLVVK